MGIDIDMLSVADADAIAVRVHNSSSRPFIAVIDGGNPADGSKVVSLMKTHYQVDYIDLVVSTHPDHDHIGGLSEVVSSFYVGKVWVHDPYRHPVANRNHTNAIKYFKANGLENVATKSTDDLEAFLDLLDRRRITREEPFSGLRSGPFFVLGPSVEFYEAKLTETDYGRIAASLTEHAKSVDESGYAIGDNDETSPTNDSSTILYVKDEDRIYLFTGDAGVKGLNDARARWKFSEVYWLDTPHHGSRRNLSSSLVDYLQPKVAFVSAAGNVKHPSAAVVNALKRVDTRVYSTHKRGSLWHHFQVRVTERPGYLTAEPL